MPPGSESLELWAFEEEALADRAMRSPSLARSFSPSPIARKGPCSSQSTICKAYATRIQTRAHTMATCSFRVATSTRARREQPSRHASTLSGDGSAGGFSPRRLAMRIAYKVCAEKASCIRLLAVAERQESSCSANRIMSLGSLCGQLSFPRTFSLDRAANSSSFMLALISSTLNAARTSLKASSTSSRSAAKFPNEV